MHQMRALIITKNTKKEGKDKDLATNKVQDNHFQLPLQQYRSLLTTKPSKVRSEGIMKKRSNKHKRQKIQRSNDPGDDDGDGDDDNGNNSDDNSTTSKSGVGVQLMIAHQT